MAKVKVFVHAHNRRWHISSQLGWLVILSIYVASAIFQPYCDLEARDNQSLNILVARPGIESGPLAR